MAEEVRVGSTTVKNRNPFLVFLWSLVTLGIYYCVWYYKINRELRDAAGINVSPVVARAFLHPPATPAECLFAQTTTCLSSDLARAVTPCQFGGTPECTECGCLASAGFTALGDYRLAGVLPLRAVFSGSSRIGAMVPNRSHCQWCSRQWLS